MHLKQINHILSGALCPLPALHMWADLASPADSAREPSIVTSAELQSWVARATCWSFTPTTASRWVSLNRRDGTLWFQQSQKCRHNHIMWREDSPEVLFTRGTTHASLYRHSCKGMYGWSSTPDKRLPETAEESSKNYQTAGIEIKISKLIESISWVPIEINVVVAVVCVCASVV